MRSQIWALLSCLWLFQYCRLAVETKSVPNETSWHSAQVQPGGKRGWFSLRTWSGLIGGPSTIRPSWPMLRGSSARNDGGKKSSAASISVHRGVAGLGVGP